MARKRYAVVGTGGRGIGMFAIPAARDYPEAAELVGLCDINAKRVEYARERTGVDVPCYTDFDAMLAETAPDVVCVATKDCTHDGYIVKALEAGCDAVTEKPMTTDAAKCRAILAAEKKTGRKVRVTFNYRYSPHRARMREILQSGVIGRITSVDFHWYLDTYHGADYFRRWHRRMENSSGLLVHKATHHFDLVNWWIGEEPVEISAQGKLNFYGPTRPERGERCLTCGHKRTCEFFWDMSRDEGARRLYLDCESDDGYYRDRCVFDPEIDIYDTMTVQARYTGDVLMSYSLNAYMPYEGYRISITGLKGRLEAEVIEAGPWDRPSGQPLVLIPTREGRTIIEVPPARGGHGGGDTPLRDEIFLGASGPDPLGRAADSWDGAMSILTGVAANESIRTGTPVKVDDLLGEFAANRRR